MAAAGLMVGTPDPMEGFPAGIHFSLFGFARNTGTLPLTVHPLVNYMDKAGPQSAALPDIVLAAGEARDLKLDKIVHLPFRDGMANLSFSYDAPCGPLMLGTGSVDATGSYVFEVNPQAVGKSGGRILQYWQVGAGHFLWIYTFYLNFQLDHARGIFRKFVCGCRVRGSSSSSARNKARSIKFIAWVRM